MNAYAGMDTRQLQKALRRAMKQWIDNRDEHCGRRALSLDAELRRRYARAHNNRARTRF